MAATARLAKNLGADLNYCRGLKRRWSQALRTNSPSHAASAILAPTQEAAQLEGSKVFAKQFMERHRIPTPRLYGFYDSAPAALRALDEVQWPLVIKADGLCAGKGVLVTSSLIRGRERLSERLMARNGSLALPVRVSC